MDEKTPRALAMRPRIISVVTKLVLKTLMRAVEEALTAELTEKQRVAEPQPKPKSTTEARRHGEGQNPILTTHSLRSVQAPDTEARRRIKIKPFFTADPSACTSGQVLR